MPVRGGRAGGGSRGARPVGVGGLRAPRTSSGSSRGFRIPMGSRAPRAETSTSNPIHRRPLFRPGTFGPSGINWKIIALLLGVLAFGACALVGLGLVLQALGLGS